MVANPWPQKFIDVQEEISTFNDSWPSPRVAKVDDANLPKILVHLVVDVVATPAQQEAPYATELRTPRSSPDLRRLLDCAEHRFELAREESRRGGPITRPPAERSVDLRNRSGGKNRSVRGRRHGPLAPRPSAMPTKFALQPRDWHAPTRLDLRDPLQHARFLFGVEHDGCSLVVLDECESRTLGKTRARPDGAMNNSALCDLHGRDGSRPPPHEPS